jgi:hypothetical protein
MMTERKSAYIGISHFLSHGKGKNEKEVALDNRAEMS